MRKINFIAVLILCMKMPSGFSQIVTENVLYDNYASATDNDFVNYFTGGLGLSQATTNGITGGCLVTPNTVSWGNDNAIYCSKYIASEFDYANTRIAFKYDTTQINSSNFDRAVSLFLRPSADFNHYVIASVNYNKTLQIATYSWANSPPVLNLQHGHWYEFLLSTDFITASPLYQINVSAQVNDLGVTGQFPPIPVGNTNGTFYDSLLFGDTAVQVSLTGTLWGGAKYLDNFHFEGIKSADSCTITPTNVSEATSVSGLVFPNPFKDKLTVRTNNTGPSELILYDALLRKCLQQTFTSSTTLNIEQLSKGTYIYEVKSKDAVTKKGVIVKE